MPRSTLRFFKPAHSGTEGHGEQPTSVELATLCAATRDGARSISPRSSGFNPDVRSAARGLFPLRGRHKNSFTKDQKNLAVLFCRTH